MGVQQSHSWKKGPDLFLSVPDVRAMRTRWHELSQMWTAIEWKKRVIYLWTFLFLVWWQCPRIAAGSFPGFDRSSGANLMGHHLLRCVSDIYDSELLTNRGRCSTTAIHDRAGLRERRHWQQIITFPSNSWVLSRIHCSVKRDFKWPTWQRVKNSVYRSYFENTDT